jgi:hypothetical protein
MFRPGAMTDCRHGARLAELARHPMCGASVETGVENLAALFGRPTGVGINLAAEALAGALSEELLRGLGPAYISALLAAYRS